MYLPNIPEEELKNKIAKDFFDGFDATQILGKIDFCVSYRAKTLFQNIHFLWAEAKRGNKNDVAESFVQLILTIGKERTFENELPPLFLGAFDCEKIAFIPYYEIMDIFSQNDFNWNVAPSNHDTKEFKQLYNMSKELLESKKLQFDFEHDSKDLQSFIRENFSLSNEHIHKIQITKNNFTIVYQKWLLKVKNSISIDWNLAKNAGILDADFYLADLLSLENQSLIDKLFVVLRKTHYEFNKTMTFMGTEQRDIASFKDNQESHRQFWNIYERPPKEIYWDYIIDRRDLLVPLDIRERKGAFFTPQVWAMKAHAYLADVLGEDWQSEYVVWDCAAGTGNLFANLTEPRNFYASTLDKADVEIMKELAKNKHLPLLENHVFQFDFLNDCLLDKPCNKHKAGIDSTCKNCRESKVPKALQKIILGLQSNDSKIHPCDFKTFSYDSKTSSCHSERSEESFSPSQRDVSPMAQHDKMQKPKLVIFINPPYAEAASATQVTRTGTNKEGVSIKNIIYERYKDSMGKASNELFAQFFFRIYNEIPDCILASFSTLKYINATNFIRFRETFMAKFKKGFMIPAYTFDNVQGKFPIGFLIWDLSKKVKFRVIKLDVFNTKNHFVRKKKIQILSKKHRNINQWYSAYYNADETERAIMNTRGNDFQNQNYIRITSHDNCNHTNIITQNNLIPSSVYFAVRHCIKATWINDRDQFLMPNKEWAKDREFQNDCLAFMLFHGQNRIMSKEGINHFIPFSETDVGAKEAFESDFMIRFINGKIKDDSTHLPNARKHNIDVSASPQHDKKNCRSEEDSKNCRPKEDSKSCHVEETSKFCHVERSETSQGKESPPNKVAISRNNGNEQLFFETEQESFIPTEPLEFSEEAKAVFAAGLELWRYYHSQNFVDSKNPYNPNASLYDIKAHFQGMSPSGRMNPPQKAQDSYYKDLIGNLNYELENLAKKIEPKVYEYGFLLE
ncbi:hypothetical protein [Helicobacter aurati]|uniref:hypothetical protein n=1 Tax=Helicobacter aurati TaxID=137778 RepID=UPI001F3049BB|nr:hypothetical protein [Helicobacter aurati]